MTREKMTPRTKGAVLWGLLRQHAREDGALAALGERPGDDGSFSVRFPDGTHERVTLLPEARDIS